MSAAQIPTFINVSQHAALAHRYVPEIWRKTPEELWADVCWQDVLRQRGNDISSGVLFARKMEAAGLTLTAKDEARRRVLYALDRLKRRGRWMLKVLTMPGLAWKFEAMLLERWKRVRVFAVERDPAIYFGSIKFMPAAEDSIIQQSPHCIGTSLIESFYFTAAEAFITDPYCPDFDAAWFDFNGQLSVNVVRAIKKFWFANSVRQITVTSLNGRFRTDANECVKRHGGVVGWLSYALKTEPLDEFQYSDGGAGMVQATFEKTRDDQVS